MSGNINLDSGTPCPSDSPIDLSGGISNSSRISGGSGPCLTCFKYSNILWVDPAGSDTTAIKGDIFHPWKTIKAAETKAVSGDAISIMPGVYNEGNLGKDGITYYLNPGAKILGPANTNIFTDNGTAISFNVLGHGVIETTTGSWFRLTNSGSIVNVEVSELIQTSFSTSKDPLVNYGIMRIDIKHRMDNNADNWYCVNTWPDSETYINANYVSSRCRVLNNRGKLYYSANYTKVFSTNAYENAVGSSNSAAYMHIKGGVLRIDNGGAIWTGGLAPQEGTIELTGVQVVGTSDIRPMIDVGHVNNNDGILILNNCTVEVEESANLPIAIVRSDTRTRLIARNTEFINHNTGSISGGIQIENNNSIGPVELTNCIFRLNSTAVAAGAKAIRDNASGTIYYKAFTDLKSNGGWEGVNLISGTFLAVDANVKSD